VPEHVDIYRKGQVGSLTGTLERKPEEMGTELNGLTELIYLRQFR
jgi:hypothetical protein